MFICHRLREEGHSGLVVGGAVRDLLVGRHPKDFDLVTSARPEAVRALFRNARIIGRRFRLVQLRWPSMSVEVSTFRSEPRRRRRGVIRRDNTYGTPEEDAFRRDFTVNALSFDPLTMTLYDYVGAMDDLEQGVIRTIKPPDASFQEDPVRMLRAVRFKVRLGFSYAPGMEATIRKRVRLLGDVTRHRLAEEMQRFLTRGNAAEAYAEFERLGLLRPLLGMRGHEWFFSQQGMAAPMPRLKPFLERMDQWVAGGGEPIPPTVALLGLLLTMACADVRELVLGSLTRGRRRKPPRGFHDRLGRFMSDWGLLKGQVEPALRILEAADGLLRDAPRSKPPAVGPDVAPGTREAWLLLAILQDELGVAPEYLERGLARLHELPDLPILDHPRPPNRLGGAALRVARRHARDDAGAAPSRSRRA